MTKYRIKEVTRVKFINGVAKKEIIYVVQNKRLFYWINYVFTEMCNRSGYASTIFRIKNKYFDSEECASEAIEKIKNLYVGKYKGRKIEQTYDGAYISYNLGYENSYHDHYYYVFRSLKDIQDSIDTLVCKNKIRYIKK